MGYIGNEPTTGHFPVQTNLVGAPSGSYTLDRAPASAGAIEVSVQGVLQPTTAYSVSGTTLTMAGVTTGIPIFIRYLGETLTLPTIADGTVVESKIGAGAVTGSKIQMGSDQAGDIITYNGTDYIRLAKGTAAQVLKMNAGATAVEWGTDTGGIAVPGSSVVGDTLYHNGTIYTRLAKGTAAQVLTMNAGATAPEWAAPASSSFPIGASAHIGGSHQSVATGTATKLAFNTELYDPNSNFNTTTFAYTVPSGQAGKYLVTAFAGVQALGDGKRVSIQIYKNNSVSMSPYASASGAFSEYMSVAGILDLAVADYIEVWGWHNKGSNGDFSASAYDSVFSIQRIV